MVKYSAPEEEEMENRGVQEMTVEAELCVSMEDVQREMWQRIQHLEAATTPSIRAPAPTIQSPLKLHKPEMFGRKGKESIDA